MKSIIEYAFALSEVVDRLIQRVRVFFYQVMLSGHPCPACGGAKMVPNTRRLSINIPAGVDDGVGIRLAGEGELGGYGGPPGDMHVYISVRPHQFFVRQGNHIILELGINVAQAALGDAVTVPTLDGEEELVVYLAPVGKFAAGPARN